MMRRAAAFRSPLAAYVALCCSQSGTRRRQGSTSACENRVGSEHFVCAEAINGNRDRGTGILNKELYIGRLVWNRLRYSKDPDTGRRRSRQNDPAAVLTTEVPALRIVSDDVWQSVRARQARRSRREHEVSETGKAADRFWSKRRPK